MYSFVHRQKNIVIELCEVINHIIDGNKFFLKGNISQGVMRYPAALACRYKVDRNGLKGKSGGFSYTVAPLFLTSSAFWPISYYIEVVHAISFGNVQPRKMAPRKSSLRKVSSGISVKSTSCSTQPRRERLFVVSIPAIASWNSSHVCISRIMLEIRHLSYTHIFWEIYCAIYTNSTHLCAFFVWSWCVEFLLYFREVP